MDAYISHLEIASCLSIERGSVLYISSDVLSLAKIARNHGEIFNAGEFINSFRRVVGSEGTLIFPTFNWGFCKGKTFDYRNTRGETGSLGNEALRMPGFCRTVHPIYSFAVWGKSAETLCKVDNKMSFGMDSPFAWMHKNGCKNLLIDVHMWDAFTFTHYVEHQLSAPYRFHKDFTSNYIDCHGINEQRTYSMYVRDLDINVKMNQRPMEKDLLACDIAVCQSVNDIEFTFIDLARAFDVIAQDVKCNRSRKICSYDGQEGDSCLM